MSVPALSLRRPAPAPAGRCGGTGLRRLALALVAAASAGCTGFDVTPGELLGFGSKPAAVLGDFESDAEMQLWGGAVRWGRRSELQVSLSEENATSGAKSLKVVVQAGRSASLALKSVPADWRAYESLVFDVFTPKTGEAAEWVPFSLFADSAQSSDWFTRIHHDSRLGVVAGRRSTVELSIRELQVYNARREKLGPAQLAGGYDGIESPLGMLSRPFDVSSVTMLEMAFAGAGADRTFFVDNVRLTKPPDFDGPVATTPSTLRVGSPYRFFAFDLNRGGAFCDMQMGNVAGLFLRYASERNDWHSSAAGTNHSTIKVLEKSPERLRVRVAGGFYGPWPSPHVDLQSEATFEYLVEQPKGERFPTVKIDAALRRSGAAVEGLRSLDLVWPCGQRPTADGVEMQPGAEVSARTFIAGSPRAFGGKRWLALVSERPVKAVYAGVFNGEHELRIPVGPLAAGGAIPQGFEWKTTLSLVSVLDK